MLALIKPSSVATRSSTRGTSCGVTVVTRTSGAVGSGGAGFREQLIASDTQIRSATKAMSLFINFTIADRKPSCRARMRRRLTVSALLTRRLQRATQNRSFNVLHHNQSFPQAVLRGRRMKFPGLYSGHRSAIAGRHSRVMRGSVSEVAARKDVSLRET
jgi:hypothetical protein